ncbi:MAG: hypothetical protein SGI72_15890 [Planctomycetota bacterium]|nr:hypothetical protein [Planctomycetota bacterium]
MSIAKKLALALAALVTTTVLAQAQATEWDRRIGDIHIVHPPGTPPGWWRATVDVVFSANGVPPGTLSFDTALYLNGMLIDVVHTPIEPNLAPMVCPGICSGGCSIAQSFGVALAGSCLATGGCHCEKSLAIDLNPFTAGSTDLIFVQVTPGVGSLIDTNTSNDFMSRLVGENNPGTVTCTGDGTGTACPCANSGSTGRGCANSSNPAGAELTATGFTEALLPGTDSVVLHLNGLPPGTPVLYFQGTSNALNIPFGDGTLCTTGAIVRMSVKFSSGGSSSFPGAGDPSVSQVGGAVLGSGSSLYYQAYYRDSAAFCTTATFNMTNGIKLTWN